MKRSKKWMMVFAVLLILFGLQDGIQDSVRPMKLLDEGIALLAVPLFVLRARQRKVGKEMWFSWLTILAPFGIYLLCGWIGTAIWHYQPAGNVLKDFFAQMKFFLAFAAAYLLFQPQRNFRRFYRLLWPVLYAVTFLLFLLCVLDLCFGIFWTETRYGLPAIKLYFQSYTALVAYCCLLAAVYLRLYEAAGRKILPPLGMIFFVLINTRRSKALAAMVLIFVIYRLAFHRGKRMSRKVAVPAGICVGIAVVSVLWRAFYYYYKWGTRSARLVLTMAAPYIARDYFPFGTGWATYGSGFSVDPYSPVYTKYGLDAVWGLSESFHDFVSDTFWPMILAQSGVIGCAAYLWGLVSFVRKVMKKLSGNSARFASGLFLMVYLLAASVNETAFVAPIAVPFAFWLGILYAEAAREEGRTEASK